MLVVFEAMSTRSGAVVNDDVLYRFRLRLFSLAAELGNVRAACRTMGVHPSTYYRWRGPVLRSGLEMLRPRERRPPRMPNQTSVLVEQRVIAFALGQPGLGPRRISATLAQQRWGGIVISPNGVWRILRRHGLNRRISRLSLVAGYAAPPGPERPIEPERHVEVGRPGELVGFDCFHVGRLASVTDWLRRDPATASLALGYFGASTGAGAALVAAAARPADVGAIVSRGGRPDLAGDALERVRAPTLLIVGGNDPLVLDLNRQALARLPGTKRLVVVPGATHLFEEPGALEQVAALARDWFVRYLAPATDT